MTQKHWRRLTAESLFKSLSILIILVSTSGCGERQQNQEKQVPLKKAVQCPKANLILISIDTLRADRLSCYGYERETSPGIDILAKESIQFNNHVTSMTTTLPAHLSMFTGLHPRTHGILSNGTTISDEPTTLAEVLRDQGYTTAAVIAANPMHSQSNINQGFDFYSDLPVDVAQVIASDVAKRATAWIESNTAEPFFLFLHFFDPHSPRTPPEGFSPWEKGLPSHPKERARYDGEILYVDTVLQQLFTRLKDKGYYDESLIVLTSDHGESLGEHKFWGHGRCMHEVCLRVPLLIRFPSQYQIPHRIEETQSTVVDLFPTLLHCLDIPYEGTHEGLDLFGDKISNREFVFAQRQYFGGQDTAEVRPLGEWETYDFGNKYVIRSNDAKYHLLTRMDDEFYQISEDPYETKNLLNTGRVSEEQTEEYRQLIKAWQDGAIKGSEDMVQFDENTRKMLQALGYLK